MDQEMLGVRQDVVAVQRHLAGMAEILHQLGGFRVHADIAEQPDLEHAREHVAGDRRAAALLGENSRSYCSDRAASSSRGMTFRRIRRTGSRGRTAADGATSR